MLPHRLLALAVLAAVPFRAPAQVSTPPEVPVAAVPATAAEAPDVRPEVGVDLSLFPPISLNGERPALNKLSLGIVARSGELRGLALAGVHWSESDVTGVQLTWAGSARGAVRGVQASQVASIARDVRGLQATGVVNLVHERVRGVQGAGVLNLAGDVRGVQAAPVSIADRIAGLQLSVVNVGGDVTGSQIGIVNVARRVSGLQLGVVNVSRSADAAVGLVSAVAEGRHEVELFATELSPMNVALRLGGRRVYGVLVAGVDPEEQREVGMTRWTAGGGLGAGFALAPRLTLDVDALAQTVRYDDDDAEPDNVLASVRAIVGFRATPWLGVFAGPTVNLLVSDGAHPDVDLGRKVDLRETGRLWAGFVAGLRI